MGFYLFPMLFEKSYLTILRIKHMYLYANPDNILFTFKDTCFQLLFCFLGINMGALELLELKLVISLQDKLAITTGFSN